MLRLPYGISNFAKIAKEGYYFVDRTPFVAQIEQMNEPYLFFLRPRRFGKSLFISLLHCYYGLEHQAEFADLFGAYAIGQNPTPLANQYLVLRLDFSKINTQTPQSTFNGFLENVKQGISNFLAAYTAYYGQTRKKITHKLVMERGKSAQTIFPKKETYQSVVPSGSSLSVLV